MKIEIRPSALQLLLVWWLVTVTSAQATGLPIVIAHRGASGYLPEHTLPAVAAAHVMGADYIEQDVVLSRDGVPVVLHDIHLEATTNVADLFLERRRQDGHWYAIDFDLAELKQLAVIERRRVDGQPVFANRFPTVAPTLQVPTLEEEIQLILGLNRSRNTEAGLYIELKAPRFHSAAGLDMTAAVLAVLERYQLNRPGAKVILQCFDPETLRALQSQYASPLPRIQLIGDNSWDPADSVDYSAMLTPQGLEQIAHYADGIGPWIPQLFDGQAVNSIAEHARARGLLIHPYTVRADALMLGAGSIDELHHKLLLDAGVDGVFSDFPDQTRQFIDQHASPLLRLRHPEESPH